MMSRIESIARRRRLAGLLSTAAVVASAGGAATPAVAASHPVVSGTFDWAQVSIYNKSPNRTFLGHITNPAPGSGANGSVTGTDGVTITDALGTLVPSITGTSPRVSGTSATVPTVAGLLSEVPAATYTSSFPAAGGTFDALTNSGTLEYTGTLSFLGYPWLGAGAPPVITVTNPKIELSGATGKLFASGQGNPSLADTYTRESGPLFTLDLSKAESVIYADGSRGLRNIVPTLALGNVWGSASQYVPGTSGPDRTPNTYGTFAIRVQTNPPADTTGPKGDTGTAGVNGTNGVNGKDGASGTDGHSVTIRRLVAYLKKAPYSGTTVRKVSVLKGDQVVASGTNRGRTLRVVIAPGQRVTKGAYDLRVVGATATKKIRIG